MVIPPHLRGKTIPPHLRNQYGAAAPPGNGSSTAEPSLAVTPSNEQVAPTMPSAAPTASRSPSGLASSIHAPPVNSKCMAAPSEQQDINTKLASVGAIVSGADPASNRTFVASTHPDEPDGGAPIDKTSTSVQTITEAVKTPAQNPATTGFATATTNNTAVGAEAAKRTRAGPSSRHVQSGTHHQHTTPSQRGRGRNFDGRRGNSKWPKNSEIPKGDPNRWKIKWINTDEGSPTDSTRADSGSGAVQRKADVPPGVDPATGFLLTDFSGNWAPAPIDWDSRPAFRPEQSVAIIDKWLDRTEEEMVGKVWAVSQNDIVGLDGKTYYFAPDLNDKDLLIQGEIAPQYWSPVVIGKDSPTTFWINLINSKSPEPQDEGDLVGVRPWWERYEAGDNTLRPIEHPIIVGIQPGETEQLRLRRENDQGSLYHTENRQRLEVAKVQAERERRRKAMEKARKLSVGPPRTIKTGMTLYLRPACLGDIPRITELYNFYVENSVCVPETTRVQEADILQRFNDIAKSKLPFIVACERGGQVKSRKNRHDPIILPDRIVGFAYAADHLDPTGMYRFTADLAAYVDSAHYMKGIAACLFDKLLGLLDCSHLERGGYGADGLDGDGVSRVISNLLITVPYDKDERLEWKSRFLVRDLGFEQVAKMMGVGNKLGQSVNVATFQRKTGLELDPANPPISADYSK